MVVIEALPPGGAKSIATTQCFLGPRVALEQVSLSMVNGGPVSAAALNSIVAVVLRLVMVTGVGLTDDDPAATGANVTEAGAPTETAVPVPETAAVTGDDVPLYGIDSVCDWPP